MPPASQSMTAADALLERRKVVDETAAFIQRRDRAQAECEAWEAARNAVKAEMGAIRGLSQVTREVDSSVAEKLAESRELRQQELSALEASISARTAELARVIAEVSETGRQGKAHEAWSESLRLQAADAASALNAAKGAHQDAIARMRAELSIVGAALEGARAEIAEVRKEREGHEAMVREEDARLARRGADLAIYETRIRRMAAVAGMALPETI